MSKSAFPYWKILIIASLSIGASYLVSNFGFLAGTLIILAVISFFSVSAVVYDFSLGIYMLFFLGVFLSYINRLIPTGIPLGVIYDAIVLLTFVAIFLNTRKAKDWTSFKNVTTFFFIVITMYQVLQLFNPNAVSLNGWLVSMRNNTSFLLYIIFLQYFIELKNIKKFTSVWLGVSVLVALYGMYQEYFGLTGFEWRWIYEVPGRYDLYFIWGHMRKFSFLSDPAAYGMFMAFSGLAFVALCFGPYRLRYKIVFGFLAMLIFTAMLNSGTRTATAIVAVGLVFLILLHINSVKVILFAMTLVLMGVALFFGPFYGGTMNRIRSTFTPSEDASMAVRDYKRIKFQTYIKSHPIGGGLLTTGTSGLIYSPGHPLAEGWDADSGYLLIALEMGWIGLIIFMSFFAVSMIKGVQNHYAIRDPILRNFNLVFVVPFFALSVGHFAQHGMFQKPANLIIIATYALIIRLRQFDEGILDYKPINVKP